MRGTFIFNVYPSLCSKMVIYYSHFLLVVIIYCVCVYVHQSIIDTTNSTHWCYALSVRRMVVCTCVRSSLYRHTEVQDNYYTRLYLGSSRVVYPTLYILLLVAIST
jgi:hypothetical protein